MINKFETTFSNSKLLMLGGIVGMILFLCWSVSGCMEDGARAARYLFCGVLYLGLIIGLLLSYKKGAISCQKALLSALLAVLLKDSFEFAWEIFETKPIGAEAILAGIPALLYFILLINHVILQSDHVGTKAQITINQIVPILIILVLLLSLFRMEDGEAVIGPDWFFHFAELFTTLMIISIDTKVQVYKRLRAEAQEQGSWNEETREQARKIFRL